MAQHLVLCAVLCSTLFCVPALAPQSERAPKIGFISVRPDDSKGTFEEFINSQQKIDCPQFTRVLNSSRAAD
jgi:hypothetical protein